MKYRRNIHRSMWKLFACWENSKWHYHGNQGTKIMGWGDVRLIAWNGNSSFSSTDFFRHISRRCLDQTLWHLVGISYAMWSCAVKGWFFQNGCRFLGNGQNAKEMMIAGYSPNRNWWNLIGTTPTSSGTRSTKQIGIGWTNFAAVCHGNQKGGLNFFFDSFHQTSWNFVGISTVMCGRFWGVEKNSKWRPLPW
jgi:hypothetical protein